MRKKKSRTRKIDNRKLVLLAIVCLFVIVTVAAYISQQNNQRPEKKPAEEYFRILEPTINYGEPRENGTIWLIYDISFTLQAIGGDASSVVVQSWAKAEPVELMDIPKNESRYVKQISSLAYMIQMNEDGKFPMSIRITSREAEGEMIIYF